MFTCESSISDNHRLDWTVRLIFKLRPLGRAELRAGIYLTWRALFLAGTNNPRGGKSPTELFHQYYLKWIVRGLFSEPCRHLSSTKEFSCSDLIEVHQLSTISLSRLNFPLRTERKIKFNRNFSFNKIRFGWKVNEGKSHIYPWVQ